jgi:hypothetical protein
LPSWPATSSGISIGFCDHEIDAHALGADEAHHLLDLVGERLGRIVKQQMRLVEEEYQLGLFRIADLRQHLEQLGQQPQQEGRIELGALHQLVGGEHVDIAAAFVVDFEEIVDVERRFAEEGRAALAVEAQQLALDRADAGLGHIAIARLSMSAFSAQ